MKSVRVALAAIVVLISTPSWADSLPDTVRDLLEEYWTTRDAALLTQLVETDNVSFYIFDRFVDEQMPRRISIAALRGDLQLGSLAPTSASTSIVARPGASDLISAAMESGAVGRKTDETGLTFSFNALPVYQILSGRMPLGCGTLEEDCRQGGGRWVRGLSGSISLRTSNPTTPIPEGTSFPAGDFSGLAGFLTSRQQVQAISARYELFVRERESEAQMALDEAARVLSDKAASFMATQEQFETRLEGVIGVVGMPGWAQDTLDALRRNSNSLDRMAEVLLDRYRLAYEIAGASTALQGIHATTVQEKLRYIEAQNKVLAEKLYRKALTVDYVNGRPSDQPWLHEIRLVGSTPLGGEPTGTVLSDSRNAAAPPLTLTLNGGVSLYHHRPAGTDHGRVRSAQASLALDWSPSGWGTIRPTYTLGYYFQYMIENGVIQFNQEAITPGGAAIPVSAPAVEVLDTKGPIHVGQLRVNIPLGNSGVSFPAAVSYSNRTELITGRPFWQTHVGVTYDLSRLKSFLQSSLQ